MKPFYLFFLFPALLFHYSCTPAQSPSSQEAQVETVNTLPTLRAQIFRQVREGNTAEALDLFEKSNLQDARLFKAQFEKMHQDFSKGLIGFDDVAMTLARIHYAILEMTPGEAPAAEKTAISNEQIRKLAEEGELEEALHLLLPVIEKDATLLQARLHSTEKYYKQGLVSEEQLDRLKLNVKFAILELADSDQKK